MISFYRDSHCTIISQIFMNLMGSMPSKKILEIPQFYAGLDSLHAHFLATI